MYTYLGEGYFKVWHQGVMFKEDLGFSPYNNSQSNRCADANYCWGELEKELIFSWWVKVRNSDERVGWSDEPENFTNKDACG